MKARSWATSQSVTVSASEATTRRGGPKGASASKRREAGARSRRTPESRSTRPARRIVMSVRERRSRNSRQRASSSARVLRTSGGSGWRGGSEAHPPEKRSAPSSSPASLLLLGLGTVTALGPPELLLRLAELLLDRVVHGDFGIRLVHLESPLPRGDGVVGAAGLDEGVRQVVEDDRIFLSEADRELQLVEHFRVALLLV